MQNQDQILEPFVPVKYDFVGPLKTTIESYVHKRSEEYKRNEGEWVDFT